MVQTLIHHATIHHSPSHYSKMRTTGFKKKWLTKAGRGSILFKVIKMEVIQKDELLREIKPYLKEMVEEIVAESVRRGEMRELFEDLVLAKAMEETEGEESLLFLAAGV